jgi:NAD(P)-dependent dehydrogenase (short-subunit alcohol dehydrogenase family)
MELGLKDKVVIVSGGARGIGAAIGKGLSEEGAIPVIIDLRKEAGEQLVEEIGAQTGKALFISADLRSLSDIRSAVKTVTDELHRIDGLVNNAGVNDGIGLESGDPDGFRTSLSKNLLHYYDLAHCCLPEMKKNGGAIVNIASKVAVTGQGNTSGYAASKGGQLALTREWAVELLKYGIRVNAVVPAEVKTPLYEEWIATFDEPEAKLHEIQEKIPLEKRMTTPEEVASMAVFLLSDRASHITGQHIFVDGGYTHLDRGI